VIRKLALLLLGILGVGVVLAAPAGAHATVVASDPRDGARLRQAPQSVTIVFDEAVGLGYLHVTNQQGARVDAGAAKHPGGDASKIADQLRAGLGDGSYTASFRVISADGHPVAGTIRFVVGNGALVHGTITAGSAANGATSVGFDVLRWISFAGLALLGGAWLLFTVWPEGEDDARARGIVWTGWGAATFAAAVGLLIQGPYTGGRGLGDLFNMSLLNDTLHTHFGVLYSIRLVLLGALAFLLPVIYRGRWPAALLGAGIVATYAGDGHASTTAPSWLSMPIDGVHLAGMAVWLGGLVLLLAAVLPRREPDELRVVLPVFSTVAFVAVCAIAASGLYAAVRGIGTVNAIFTTTYGLLVLTKIVLFIGLLAVANFSRRLVRRRTIAFAMTDTALDEPVEDENVDVERLRRSVVVEVCVALVVLAVTAVLVGEPRGKEALAADYRAPVSASTSLGGGRSATVTADPGTHGPVDVTVLLHGAPTAKVTATATQHSAEIGPIPIRLTAHGGGHFDGTATLPVAGSWDIDLVVTTSAFDATTADVTLHLH
jgi:copper transport protein